VDDSGRRRHCFGFFHRFPFLPNGATRSPDASWIRRTRWDALPAEDQQRFAPICPDFVVELHSPSDAIDDLETKMMSTSPTEHNSAC
jgi:Uma2 family endonuclease